jgi:hypothetical protein
MIWKSLFRKILIMKKLSILASVLMVLAFIFYSLVIISKDNECTSVRKYLCEKRDKTQIVNTWAIADTQSWVLSDTWSLVNTGELLVIDDKVRADITPAWDLFTKWLDTALTKIISKDTSYELVYEWDDSLIVDISKDRYWTEKVVINGKQLSRDEINAYFYITK